MKISALPHFHYNTVQRQNLEFGQQTKLTN